jgi:hypothetical protein
MSEIHWSELGSPTQSGLVDARGYGPVQVDQLHIDRAADHGGKCSFKIDATGHHLNNKGPRYRLGVLPNPD